MTSVKSSFTKLASFVLVTAPTIAFAQKEAAPEAPKVAPTESVGMRTQAGIGSEVSFARAGVVELGGSVAFTSAEKLTSLSFAPTAGYFFADNLQISGILNWNHSKVGEEKATNVISLIAEPSFHYPLTNEQFTFIGLGAGALFQEDVDTGFAISPRIGFKNLIGRSGMVTADVRAIYSLNDTNVSTSEGNVLAVKSAYGMGIGYTVLL